MNESEENFKTWMAEAKTRGIIMVPLLGDWETMKQDLLELFEVLIAKGLHAEKEIVLPIRAALGRDTDVDVMDERAACTIIITPDDSYISVVIVMMKYGKYEGIKRIYLWVPDFEALFDGRDGGWAYWFRRQMPDVDVEWNGWNEVKRNMEMEMDCT